MANTRNDKNVNGIQWNLCLFDTHEDIKLSTTHGAHFLRAKIQSKTSFWQQGYILINIVK